MADTIRDDEVIVQENVLDQHYQYLKDPSAYITYKRRWFLLFVIMIINFANALIWIVFSPVTDQTAEYYHITFMQVNWLSLVYLVASIPSGFFASWLLDTMGLRASIIGAAVFNLVGAAVRNLTVFSFTDGNKFSILITGQTIAACGQTFIMFTPAKTAALWFPDSQRALATTLATMANPLGILAANVMSPAIVKSSGDLPIMLWVCSGCALVGVLLSVAGVHSSLPPTPPSPSAAAQSEPFFIGIKKLRSNTNFWLLTFAMGGGLALFTSMTTFLEQILCPLNYSNNFAGLCGALMIALGSVGAVVAGIIADKTRKFAEVAKTGFIISSLFAIAFTQFARMRDQEIAVAISIIMFGSFGFAIYPICLELAVEVTYPVAEATSTGLIFLSGQIQGVILMLVAQYTAQPLSPYNKAQPQACPGRNEFEPQDWTVPNLIGNGACVVYVIVLVLFFKPVYKRMTIDSKAKTESSLQGNIPPDIVS